MKTDSSKLANTGLSSIASLNAPRFRWMAGSAACAAGATAIDANADIVQITQIDNFVSHSGGNNIVADFTGDGNGDARGGFIGTAYTVMNNGGPMSSYTTVRYRARVYDQYLNDSSMVVRKRFGRAEHSYRKDAFSTNSGFYALAGRELFSTTNADTQIASGSTPQSVDALVRVTFTDEAINFGEETEAYMHVRASNTSINDHEVRLVRLIFDDASTERPETVAATDPDFPEFDPGVYAERAAAAAARAAAISQLNRKIKKLNRKAKKLKRKGAPASKIRRLKQKVRKLKRRLRQL